MRPQEQKLRRASVERHEISRLEVTEQLIGLDSMSDRFRFLKLAAIALDGPDGTPYAENGADHDGLIWNVGLWHDRAENRRHASELLHYEQN
jgi:hypothetical protein